MRSFLSPIQPIYTGISFLEGWIEEPSVETAQLVGHGTLFGFNVTEAVFAQRNGGGRICVYAALKRTHQWFDEDAKRHSLKEIVTQNYDKCAPNVRQLLDECSEFVRRPINSLPVDFKWISRKNVTLIGDAAHVMPPVGVGVNLAMLDASDVATALCSSSDYSSVLRDAETMIVERDSGIMPEANAGFQEWFTENHESVADNFSAFKGHKNEDD